MKFLFGLIILFVSVCTEAQTTNPKYDSLLAKKVGADDYGMKMYVFVVLVSGNNTSADKKFRDSCFAGHMQNIDRLVKENKLLVAGPFGKNDKNMRGLFVLNVPTIEEAKVLLDTDPAIKNGFLSPELYPWYGSAALGEYLEASEKVWKKGF